MRNALAESAVAHLVVALQEGDEGLRRQMRARLAAHCVIAIGRRLSLVGESFRQAASEEADRFAGVVRVIPIRLTGSEDVQRVVKVVIPLGGILVGAAAEIARLVGVVFENQVHLALPANACVRTLRQFGENVRLGVVGNACTASRRRPSK